MPTVTAIEPQKRKEKRFNIFLDGKFAFGASDLVLLEEGLKVGKIIKAEEVAKIIQKEQGTKLLDLATNFLSFRSRSEKEVRDYLIKKISSRENIKFTLASQSPLVSIVIAKLKKYQYLDDLQFARWFLASRLRSRPKGLSLIKLELKKKGISQDIIDSVFDRPYKESDLAKKAIEKRIARWHSLPDLEFKKKFYQYLAARGFSYDTIKETFAFFTKKR
ncbi:RecX family transcriptional regulator [Candidatus Curtissbacteria bacterium]|nr:RecX family transcriptional regulator [Candidatus Curtissbacteria bacterium]